MVLGKTTLIRVISGLQRPSSGEYSLYGVHYKDKNILDERKRISAIIEKVAISQEMTVEENLKYQYKIIGLPEYDGLEEILETIGLKDNSKDKAKHLSLGMKQRLGIGISLVGNPDFLILDEPINGIDPQGIIEIRELILKLNKENGITFLISSHYLDELSKIATNYGFINKGKIIKEISKEEIKKESKRRIEIEVSNVDEAVKYFEKMGFNYEVISDKKINIYDKINITELAIALSNQNCDINNFKEVEESLENYFINLIGGVSDA